METVKHTPGPWALNKYGEPVGPDGENIRAKGLALTNSDEAKANTRLIAAAPDLLEALRLAKDVIKIWHGANAWNIYERSSPEMKAINAAIAKAEGQS